MSIFNRSPTDIIINICKYLSDEENAWISHTNKYNKNIIYNLVKMDYLHEDIPQKKIIKLLLKTQSQKNVSKTVLKTVLKNSVETSSKYPVKNLLKNLLKNSVNNSIKNVRFNNSVKNISCYPNLRKFIYSSGTIVDWVTFGKYEYLDDRDITVNDINNLYKKCKKIDTIIIDLANYNILKLLQQFSCTTIMSINFTKISVKKIIDIDVPKLLKKLTISNRSDVLQGNNVLFRIKQDGHSLTECSCINHYLDELDLPLSVTHISIKNKLSTTNSIYTDRTFDYVNIVGDPEINAESINTLELCAIGYANVHPNTKKLNIRPGCNIIPYSYMLKLEKMKISGGVNLEILEYHINQFNDQSLPLLILNKLSNLKTIIIKNNNFFWICNDSILNNINYNRHSLIEQCPKVLDLIIEVKDDKEKNDEFRNNVINALKEVDPTNCWNVILSILSIVVIYNYN